MTKRMVSSVSSQRLGYKLKMAFYLTAIIPLLVTLYLVSNYILPQSGVKADVIVSVVVSIFIAVFGFLLIREVIRHIVSLSAEAKLIAAGDIERKLKIDYEDEVGDLGVALNQLTSRIRSNMEELKSYSEKTNEINIAIQKRVIMLSNLLQISSLISQGEKLEEILRLIVGKARFLADSDTAYLLMREGEGDFSVKAADGEAKERLLDVNICVGEPVFDLLTRTAKPLIFDKLNNLSEGVRKAFVDKFGAQNSLVLRIYLKSMVIGVLGIGNNREEFLYTKDDMELLDIFSKQIAIAVENDILAHRVERLEVKDALTGLYNRVFIRERLEEEIKRANAYHRPCAFILLSVDNLESYRAKFGSLQAEAVLKKAAVLINGSVTEIDRVSRFADSEFAVILPEKNKRQAVEIAAEIKKRVESAFSGDSDAERRVAVKMSVAENPLDGADAEELISKAKAVI